MDLTFRGQGPTLDRLLWIIALASMAETSLQALDAILQGSWRRFALWFTGSCLIGILAIWAETVKRRTEG